MSEVTRRSFLEHSLFVAAAGLASAKALGAKKEEPTTRPSTESRRVPPSEQIGIAVIGLNGRGLNHLEEYADAFLHDQGVNVVALCDVDEKTFGKAQRILAEKGRPQAKQYTDIRKLLEDKEVQAVSIATPNHWHSLAAFWAMQAGRDAYVEKPISHELKEGRTLEQARIKFKRVCQAGTQSRSFHACQQAIKYIHDGHIGKVLLSRGLCYKRRMSIGHFADGSVPAGVHYDLWLGPAPVRPFNKNRFHYNWHWNWDYGNGDIGNQGIHQMDIARWALNKTLPTSAISLGGRYGYKDDGLTPNTQLALFDYGDNQLLFEVRGLETSKLMGVATGNIVYGTEGFVAFTADYDTAAAFDNQGKRVKVFKGKESHFANFVDAVRSRKQEDLNCPILEGHLSACLVHMCNISYRLGHEHPFSVRNAELTNIDLVDAFGRMVQHLADNTYYGETKPQVAARDKSSAIAATRSSQKPQPLQLQEMSYQIGPKLAFNPETETFVDNSKANEMLTRDYRPPFVVPEHV